jgi:hypothetical protein
MSRRADARAVFLVSRAFPDLPADRLLESTSGSILAAAGDAP